MGGIILLVKEPSFPFDSTLKRKRRMLNDLYHVQNNLEQGWKFETLNRFDKRNQTNKEKKDGRSSCCAIRFKDCSL